MFYSIVPLVAPKDVRVKTREEGTVLITWSTLTPEEARGEVVGYQVSFNYNGSRTIETVANPWLEADGLMPGRLYAVRVAALTEVGPGPFTSPVLMDTGLSHIHPRRQNNDDSSPSVLYSPPQPAWLIYLLIPAVLLMSIATLFYVRHLRGKSAASNPSHTPSIYQDASLYSAHHSINMYSEQKLWRPSDYDREINASSKKLLHPEYEYAEPRIQKIHETTEPYATTALLASSSQGSGYRSPWIHQSDDSGVQVNWTDFLPPPPACPPPRDFDLGDLSRGRKSYLEKGSPLSTSKYDNMDESEQYERPCDVAPTHCYAAYGPVSHTGNCGKFPTFNTLQALEYRRVRTDFRPLYQADPPRSNTH